MREIGYRQCLSEKELIDGDALKLQFKNGEFDLVCAFGVLHHIKHRKLLFQKCLGSPTKQYSCPIQII